MISAYLRATAVWTAILGGVIAPTLLATGYPLWSLEVLATYIAAAMLGILVAWWAPVSSTRSSVLIWLAIMFYVAAYFKLNGHPWLLFAIAVCVAIVATKARAAMPTIAALGLCFGVVGAEISRPDLFDVRIDRKLPADSPNTASDRLPSIIHIVLDEHAGPAGLPPEILGPDAARQLTDFYVGHGFTVFDRAYSLDLSTPYSIARFFGPKQQDPAANLVLGSDQRWRLKSAPTLADATRGRTLEATEMSWIDLTPILSGFSNVRNYTIYNEAVPVPVVLGSNLSIGDRLWIAAALTASALRRQKIPFLHWIVAHSGIQDPLRRSVESRDRIHGIISAYILDQLTKQLASDATRGTYYFAHVLLPHFPYVFDSACSLRPAREWLNQVDGYGINDPDSRAMRYRNYYRQLLCTQRHVAALLDAIDRNPKLADAVVIIHGDHGSRIILSDTDTWSRSGYDYYDNQRDWRLALYAVRLPGQAATVDHRTVEIHEIFHDLVDHDFKAFGDIPAHPGALPPHDACARWSADSKAISRPFQKYGTSSGIVALPDLQQLADSDQLPTRSPLLLCENGQLLGPPHALHVDIKDKGHARFSHYGGNLIFSSSDGSDPDSNGREYRMIFPPQ